jgi:hypothetical protein
LLLQLASVRGDIGIPAKEHAGSTSGQEEWQRVEQALMEQHQ